MQGCLIICVKKKYKVVKESGCSINKIHKRVTSTCEPFCNI